MPFWPLFGRIPCLRRRVLVNLTDSADAIQGVLFEQRGSWLVLKDARLVPATGAPAVPMDGDVVIECARISFLQVSGA